MDMSLPGALFLVLALAICASRADPSTSRIMTHGELPDGGSSSSGSSCHDWPSTCPGTFPQGKQTWLMNLSTIIMPCNDTGYTDPKTTLGWGVVDFDWSNGKGVRLECK